MSWAEIKKAVNSRMADMPLDDMFGLEYVKTQAHQNGSQQGTITVGNMTGLALVTPTISGSFHGYFQIQDSGYTSDSFGQDNSTFALVPLSKGHYTSISGAAFFVMIFAWGGVYLNRLTELIRNAFRREVLA